MFKDTYPHLFNVGSTKDSCGDNTPRILSGAKAPRPYGNTARQKPQIESG